MWLAFFLLGSVPAFSQALLSVRGTITDPSGAAVPNATVHLINAANADRTATTDQSGAYTFQQVAPGTYQLRVEAQGFEDYSQSNIRLDTNASTTLDVKLKIVQVQENVNVTAQIGQQCLAAQGRIFPDVGPGLRAIRRSSSGNYYILTAPGAVAIYNADGKKIGQVPAEGSPDSSIIYGTDMQLDSTGRVFVADRGANAIKIYGANGALAGKFTVIAPISVQPISNREVAVASLFSRHLVEIYDPTRGDPTRGQPFRSFGEIDEPIVAECDSVTLNCTARTQSGDVVDDDRLKHVDTSINHGWFYGDSAGNIYVNVTGQPDPTIRKYDGYGYAAYDSTFPLNQAVADTDTSNWSARFRPEARATGVGSIASSDGGAKNGASDPAGNTAYGITAQMQGSMPTVGGPETRGGAPDGGIRPGGSGVAAAIQFVQRTRPKESKKTVIDAIGVDAASQEIWAAIGGDIVHFDKDGNLAADYCLSPTGKVPVRPTAILVEPERILVAVDPFGIFQYARPDKIK